MTNACSGVTAAASEPFGHGNGVDAGATMEGQGVILGVVEGDADGDAAVVAEEWDARFELALGNIIRRLIAHDPPPAGSRVAADAQRWSEALRSDGQARLAAAGLHRLRAV